MKIWYHGAWENIEIGQRVTVFKASSGFTAFGEGATLTRTTKQHLVFTTDSGATVKTALDNIHCTVGKARRDRYAVSLKQVNEFPNLIIHEVRFWNPKTCKSEIK